MPSTSGSERKEINSNLKKKNKKNITQFLEQCFCYLLLAYTDRKRKCGLKKNIRLISDFLCLKMSPLHGFT